MKTRSERTMGNVVALLLLSALLAACSDDGTETILDDGPEINIGLPAFLNADFLVTENLRPNVALTGVGNVSMNNVDNAWSGTINVIPDRTYDVTVTWIERIGSGNAPRDLPLATLSLQLTVNSDGSAQPTETPASNPDGTSAYETDIDSDGDGVNNLQERQQGTDPFVSDLTANDESPMPETTAEVIVPRISKAMAPEIDGIGVSFDPMGRFTGEWAGAAQVDISGLPLHIDHLMIDRRSDTDSPVLGRRWAAMHDGEYLYIVVSVDDRQQHLRDSANEIYNDDSLELFIDGDNSKTAQYDADDFHVLIPMLDIDASDEQGAVTGSQILGLNSSREPLELEFATGPASGSSGTGGRQLQDVYEIKLDIDSAGIDPDSPFGLELQVNDDDDGQTRDTKTGWHHPARDDSDVDSTYLDASIMGTLKLE